MINKRKAITKMIEAHKNYLGAIQECEKIGIDTTEDSFVDTFIGNHGESYESFIKEYFKESMYYVIKEFCVDVYDEDGFCNGEKQKKIKKNGVYRILEKKEHEKIAGGEVCLENIKTGYEIEIPKDLFEKSFTLKTCKLCAFCSGDEGCEGCDVDGNLIVDLEKEHKCKCFMHISLKKDFE